MKLRKILAAAMAVAIVCGTSYTTNSIFSKNVQAIEVGEDRNGNTITYDDGVFTVSGTGEVQVIGLANSTGIKKLVIEEGITSIGQSSFSGWPDLEEVQLPSTLTEIKDYAFGGCYNLKRIEIPDSVTVLRNGAFSGCKKLETVKLPNSITDIPQSVFCGCESLKAIELPDMLKTIGVMAFYKCNSLTTVVIPASVTDLMQPFGLCANLESVYILNPDCEISNKRSFSNEMDENGNSVVFNGTFYGYSGSTTEEFAKKYNYKFVAIDGMDIPTTTTTTTTTTTSTTAQKTTTTTTATPEQPAVVFGDPTGDGKVDSKDASFVLVEYAKLSTGGESSLTEAEKNAADVNKDGKNDSKDASIILSYYAYISTSGTDSLEEFLKNQ